MKKDFVTFSILIITIKYKIFQNFKILLKNFHF